MFHRFFLSFHFLILIAPLLAQEKNAVDSLMHIAQKNFPDTSSVNAYLALAQNAMQEDYDKSFSYAKRGLTTAQGLADDYWMGRCYNQLGMIYLTYSYSKESVDCFADAISVLQKSNDKRSDYWIAKSQNGMGNSQRKLGRLKEATDSYLDAKKIFESIGDKKGIAGAYNNLGIIFMAEDQQEKAIEYYEVARRMNIEINNQPWLAKNLSNLGDAYFNLHQYDSAEVYFLQAKKLNEELGYTVDCNIDVMNLGNVYTSKKDFKKAKEQFDIAMDFDRRNEREADLAAVMFNFSGLFMATGDYATAKSYLDSSIAISTKYNDFETMLNVYKAYTVMYEKMGDYKNAYKYYELYSIKKDSTTSSDMKNQMDQMEESLREEVLKENNASLTRDKTLQDAALNQSRLINYTAYGGVVLVLGIAFAFFKRYQAKKKANDLLQSQKTIIEHKNKEMLDSINYASRIQQAILAPEEKMSEMFSESFLFFRPRDIVSGDFYWFAEKNGTKIIAAADCTGHGVPGAFMSMIGNAFLNEIVIEHGITKPSEILSELRRLVIHALKQKGETGEQRDGMDISLLSFSANGKIEWAGANNPLWIVRGNDCIEFTGDRRPIGFFKGQGLPFTNHEIETKKGDMLFIFTDGYADQFGGASERKMMKKKFKEILVSFSNEKAELQKKNLEERFEAWRGNLEQVDDVCVIGVRIG